MAAPFPPFPVTEVIPFECCGRAGVELHTIPLIVTNRDSVYADDRILRRKDTYRVPLDRVSTRLNPIWLSLLSERHLATIRVMSSCCSCGL